MHESEGAMADPEYADAMIANYAVHDALVEKMIAGPRAAGKEPVSPHPDDLVPVDQFHTGGKAATLRLARRAGIVTGMPSSISAEGWAARRATRRRGAPALRMAVALRRHTPSPWARRGGDGAGARRVRGDGGGKRLTIARLFNRT